ncbi:MAG: acetoacetate--CoA ligase, partial [Sphingobacteriaceae bacterium]|nr:acetoacetate--CoA ligase [Cytophagaceae bacterium]
MTSEPQPRLLWQPSPNLVQTSNLTQYATWLKEEYRVDFQDYESLHRWSVEHLESFWESLISYFNVTLHSPYERVLSGEMPQARWFEGATLNYAEHVFRQKTVDHPALLVASESGLLTEVSWESLERQTAALAAWLRRAGIQPGDRVAGYLPTIPEA